MNRMMTEAGRNLPEIPWNTYPRPQLRRSRWLCLNGTWGLHIRQKNGAERTTKITVPFCPESLLSGVEPTPAIGDELHYSRSFSLPADWAGQRILLHFGAVSRAAEVFVNGVPVARSENSYLPFTADITSALHEGENELLVKAVNDLSHKHPWGKQKEKRGGMWYTPCSGIWQSVWLEPVSETYVKELRITTGADWVNISAEGIEEGTVVLEGREYPLPGGQCRIQISQPRLWSPEDPQLYDFTLRSGSDTVASYFALRTLETRTVNGKPRLCLNGKPYFFHALLDQGYWSDGLYTPADSSCYEQDILTLKALGFNTLRKHIKIEPEQFYTLCDRLGMVVFQDMVNCGEYHFLQDTALPTAHFQRRSDRRRNADPAARENFLQAMDHTVRLLANHPCICLWTIFNEGWGQFCADDAYARLKALDASRFVSSTSGWFHQKRSDVDSLHIYFDQLHLGTEREKPQLLQEFGGFVWKVPEHSFNPQKTYGYRKYPDRETFVKALRAIYTEEVLPLARQGLCGAVYTQVSDVEDETNGIFTFDRAAQKLQPQEFADLAPLLQEAVQE